MSAMLIARAELHGLLLGLWCEDDRRWYVACEDLATGDQWQHVEVRGTNVAGMSLYGRLMDRMADPREHPARPTGEWFLVGDQHKEAT